MRKVIILAATVSIRWGCVIHSAKSAAYTSPK
jgi:hypothetical protein